MIYNIVFTEQAELDLRQIYEYIAFSLLEPETAAKQLDRIEEYVMGLNQMPERHQLYDREPWRSRGLRHIPVDNFIVYYIPDLNEQTVTIIRVMYGGRDIDKQL